MWAPVVIPDVIIPSLDLQVNQPPESKGNEVQLSFGIRRGEIYVNVTTDRPKKRGNTTVTGRLTWSVPRNLQAPRGCSIHSENCRETRETAFSGE